MPVFIKMVLFGSYEEKQVVDYDICHHIHKIKIRIEHYWAKVKKFHSRHIKKYGWRNGKSVIESLRLCPNLKG